MKRYIQVKDWFITDCISYKFWDYIEIELDEIPEYFISWIYEYTNWKIVLNQIKKEKLLEDIRIAQEEQEERENQPQPEQPQYSQEERDLLIRQIKRVETEAIETRAKYLTAEMLPEWELRTAKLTKLDAEWVNIQKDYERLLFELTSKFWANAITDII